MSVDERELSALRHLGLTEYESRIYLVLVRSGPIKAGEISFFGQVPRTKTYGAIRELERKGLLRIIPGKPEIYAASSPSEVLGPLIAKLNKDVKSTEELVSSLALTYESSKYVKHDVPKESGEFWQIEGRKSITNKINQILSDASRSVSYSTTATGLIRVYKAHSEVLENARKRGAEVRVLSSITPENSGVARELAEVVQVKRLDKGFHSNFVSVDAQQLVVIDSRPEDLRTDRGTDRAIWTTNKMLIELHEQFFERVWSLAQVVNKGKD